VQWTPKGNKKEEAEEADLRRHSRKLYGMIYN